MLRLLQLPNFRWLWLGQTCVFCASQFWVVALTWLVLEQTGSGLAVGTVLMALAVPRGLFMLAGGAISDRFPTHAVAACAALGNALLIGWIILLLLFDRFNLPMAILIAALFGFSEAFLYPAILALLPQLISRPRLGQANAWMQGSEQLTNVMGPAAAGLGIGALGLPLAFGANLVLFAIGGGCLALIRNRRRLVQPVLVRPGPARLAQEIREGLGYAWNHAAVRTSLLLIAMINFAVLGPLVIGVADLVKLRFDGSAAIFGSLQSAYGVGALLGVLVASQLKAIRQLKLPLVLLAAALGTGLMLLGWVPYVWMAAAVIALMGLGGGIVGVLGMTWLQQQATTAMQGRMMSLVMFAAVALDPFSQAISGILLEIHLTGLFVAAGMSLFVTALLASLSRT